MLIEVYVKMVPVTDDGSQVGWSDSDLNHPVHGALRAATDILDANGWTLSGYTIKGGLDTFRGITLSLDVPASTQFSEIEAAAGLFFDDWKPRARGNAPNIVEWQWKVLAYHPDGTVIGRTAGGEPEP